MDISSLVDKKNILMLFGCFCRNPSLAIKYETVESDYPERFHKIIFGAIMNIAMKKNVEVISPFDIESELSLFPTSMDIWKVNSGIQYIQTCIDITEGLTCNIEQYWDNVRKYSILRNASNELKVDISFIYEEYDELDTSDMLLEDKKKKLEKFNSMSSDDVMRAINDKFFNFTLLYKSNFNNNYSFHIADEIDDRLEQFKNQDGTFGHPYQNMVFNTVFRGKKRKKYVVNSKPSGVGKSRMMLASACDLSCDKIYDWSSKQWVSTGEKEGSLYITSELTQEEVDSIVLAHISGISESRLIEWDNITEEEDKIIQESIEVMKDSLLYCEYMEEFNIGTIESVVRKYVISKNIYGLFFDYISENVGLYAESFEKTGMKLQTHQILLSLSNALKLMCNKYGIYLESSTQLNDNWKTEGNMDASSIRGSKAIIDKTDIAMLTMRMTSKDYKKIDPILKSGFYKRPNFVTSVYKVRGGKLVNFLCFSLIDLGTCREEGIFCTDMDYNILKVDKTDLGFNLPVDVKEINYTVVDDGDSALDYSKQYVKTINK